MIADSLIDYFKTLNTSLKVEEITTIMNTPASTFPVTFQPLFTDPSILNLTQSLLNENREFETNESKSKKDNALQSL